MIFPHISPTLQNREVIERKIGLLNDLFAGPVLTPLGKNFPISASMGSIFHFVEKALRGFHVHEMSDAVSHLVSRASTSRARFMRRAEPNWLIRTRAPALCLMFRKSRAGPPLLTRSAISVISRMGSTSVAIYFNRWRVPAPSLTKTLVCQTRTRL